MTYRYCTLPEDLYITFDNPDLDGIAVGAGNSGFYRTCEDGVLRGWDAGDAVVIHDFN